MIQRNKLKLIRLWIHRQNKTVGKITDIALPDPFKSNSVSFVVFSSQRFYVFRDKFTSGCLNMH